MLTRFFQKSEPISFVSIVILLFTFIFIHVIFLFPSQLSFVKVFHVFGEFLFFTFFIFLVSFIVSKNHLTQTNYYAILFFVILIGLFPSVLTFSNISLSHLFVLLAARRIYSIRSKKQLLSKLFDSGFYIGIAYLLFPQTIVYILLIYASYFIYIKIVDKNLLLPVIGFLTPVFIVFTYFFVLNKTAIFQSLVEINLDFGLNRFLPEHLSLPLILVGTLIVLSLMKIFSTAQFFEVSNKNSNKVVIAHLGISVLILVLNNRDIAESIQYLFFPVAVLFGILFNLNMKLWIKEVVLYVFLLLAFALPFIQ